uniref:Uncharacterized protein n=1 Tax=Zygnema circumcarinatum TaxID=35869 RepID=Q32RH0_ZYGCR|nr:hypothetical protein P8547_pgp014 [Zygnema circumcarinatum]AAX45895.1 hypothetical protein [Zygnema circumcarinatum]
MRASSSYSIRLIVVALKRIWILMQLKINGTYVCKLVLFVLIVFLVVFILRLFKNIYHKYALKRHQSHFWLFFRNVFLFLFLLLLAILQTTKMLFSVPKPIKYSIPLHASYNTVIHKKYIPPIRSVKTNVIICTSQITDIKNSLTINASSSSSSNITANSSSKISKRSTLYWESPPKNISYFGTIRNIFKFSYNIIPNMSYVLANIAPKQVKVKKVTLNPVEGSLKKVVVNSVDELETKFYNKQGYYKATSQAAQDLKHNVDFFKQIVEDELATGGSAVTGLSIALHREGVDILSCNKALNEIENLNKIAISDTKTKRGKVNTFNTLCLKEAQAHARRIKRQEYTRDPSPLPSTREDREEYYGLPSNIRSRSLELAAIKQYRRAQAIENLQLRGIVVTEQNCYLVEDEVNRIKQEQRQRKLIETRKENIKKQLNSENFPKRNRHSRRHKTNISKDLNSIVGVGSLTLSSLKLPFFQKDGNNVGIKSAVYTIPDSHKLQMTLLNPKFFKMSLIFHLKEYLFADHIKERINKRLIAINGLIYKVQVIEPDQTLSLYKRNQSDRLLNVNNYQKNNVNVSLQFGGQEISPNHLTQLALVPQPNYTLEIFAQGFVVGVLTSSLLLFVLQRNTTNTNNETGKQF